MLTKFFILAFFSGLFIYIMAQLIVLPLRQGSCAAFSKAITFEETPELVKAQNIMCSPAKLFGFLDTLRALRSVF